MFIDNVLNTFNVGLSKQQSDLKREASGKMDMFSQRSVK